jgi:signal transduction histidine kinase
METTPMPSSRSNAPVADAMSYEQIEHELRTPVACVRSLSEIVRDHPDLTEDERRRFLDAIVNESERLSRTVDRLLRSPALRRGVRLAA